MEADVDGANYSDEEVAQIIGCKTEEEIEDWQNSADSETRDFIGMYITNGNKLEGLELKVVDYGDFEPLKVTRVK